MKTSLFYALNGALGAVAHESLAYFKIDSGKEEHRSLDGCSKHGKHKWVPDPSTFVFPQNDYKPGNSWDLCVDSAHCAPHEALSKVTFDFKDNGIVFNFKHIEHYKYEDVVVYVERGKPPTEYSQKYSKDSDHCKIISDYKKAKCHIPYFSLTDGGSYDELCPIKDNGGWRLYVKIKAKISHGYKKYGLFSRAGDIHEKYFTLSYTCAECKEYKHKEGKYEVIEEVEDYPEGEKKKYDEYEHEKEEKKYNDYEEEGKEKYKRGVDEEEEEEEKEYKEKEKEKEFRHEHHHKHHHHHGHQHEHKHGHKHGHLHGHLHKEHHYNHHDKHHGYGKGHEHKHYGYDHHDPNYLHEHKDYNHGDHAHHYDEHKHYDHYGHGHHHHDDYKHHEHYDPSRHHDHDSFLNDFFKKYGHYDYHHGKYHHEHHDGYNHHHARDLADDEIKKSEKDEYKHKHGHKHGHHHNHNHDHHHKHRHSHHDYHHYEHYDPGYHYDHKHHDYKNYDHKDYKHYDHKHHDYKHGHHNYDHKDYNYYHKHHDNKHYDHHHGDKHYGHHHEHHKHYEHHDPSYHYEHHKHYEHHDPSYHHEHHKHYDHHHGDKYKHHPKRSDEYHDKHHGKHYEEPVTVYYKEKAEDVNAKANHVIYEKVQKHEIPAHIYKKLAEAKKHKYDHEHKYGHEHKHAEEQYHQKKLAEAKLSKAIEEYYALHYGKQHNEHKKHGHYEHHHKEPEYKPEKYHHDHYEHKSHEPEKKYYEQKEFEHKKYNHVVSEHKKHGPKAYYEHNKYGHLNEHKHHDKHEEYEPERYNHGHYRHKEHKPKYDSDPYHDKKAFLKDYKYDGVNIHSAWEKLYKAKIEHDHKQKQKAYAVHFDKHPPFYKHSSFKRSALLKYYHGDEAVEIDTAKVEKYIEKAEYRINEGISKAIYKAINSAGDDPSTGTIIKFVNKVEAAIKYIVAKNLKKAVAHIAEIHGIEEPSADEVEKYIYKTVKHILKAADEIFTKTIDALGEDPNEKEVEYAVAKVEKLLARVVDKYVREAIVGIFDLEYVTENSYGEYEKYDKRQVANAQNVTASANSTTAANDTAPATNAISTKAVNRLMRLFMRQDSQNATQAANTTAQAANATETQTLMRFMRRQVSKADNATEAAVNATSQAANVTAEAANATETQTLMRFMRRQESKAENATAAAVNATAQAVADVDQALNTTAQAVNVTQAQNSKRTEVYSDSKIEKVVEKAAEKAADKLINKLDKEESKSQSKRDAKFYNGYLPKCKGKIIKAYGIDGLHSGPLKDFSVKSHPNTCHNHQGDYVVYSHDELKKTVYGKLYESHGGDNKFGNYFIELVKGHDSYTKDIVVSIDISDKYQYEATEAKVFIGCSAGFDNHSSDNICSEKTYPYLAVAEKGLNEFVFAIPDKYMCHEYYIAIVVDFCDTKYSS